MNYKNNLNNNKGFTLLEVLVAMVILSIISVPLLKAFATSAFTNRRAKIEMQCTTAAENIAESFRSYDIDGLIEKYNASKVDDFSTTPSGDVNRYKKDTNGVYTFELNNQNDLFSNMPEGYYAEVVLNPNSFHNFNGLNTVNLSSVSAKNSAIFTMPEYDHIDASGNRVLGQSQIDEEEYIYWAQKSEEYLNDKYSAADAEKYIKTYSVDYFRENLKREINITFDWVKKENVTVGDGKTDSGVTGSGSLETKEIDILVIRMEIKYILKNSLLKGGIYPLETTDNNSFDYTNNQYVHYYRNERIIEKNGDKGGIVLFDNTSKKTELDSVYLFFYPRYLAGKTEVGRDTIKIENKNNVPANVYLMSMDNRQYDEWNSKTPYITMKKLQVVINEGYNSGYSPITLRTNMNAGAPYKVYKEGESADPNDITRGEIDFTIVPDLIGGSVQTEKISDFFKVSNSDGKYLNPSSDYIKKTPSGEKDKNYSIYKMYIRIKNRNAYVIDGDPDSGFATVMTIDGSKLE